MYRYSCYPTTSNLTKMTPIASCYKRAETRTISHTHQSELKCHWKKKETYQQARRNVSLTIGWGFLSWDWCLIHMQVLESLCWFPGAGLSILCCSWIPECFRWQPLRGLPQQAGYLCCSKLSQQSSWRSPLALYVQESCSFFILPLLLDRIRE